MNEQIESQSSLFAEMKKNNKRRTVAYSFACSCVLARVLLQFCGFWSSTQKKWNRCNFLRTLSYCCKNLSIVASSNAYSCAMT